MRPSFLRAAFQFKQHNSDPGILADFVHVHYQQSVHAKTFETFWFLALSKHEQFRLVLPIQVSENSAKEIVGSRQCIQKFLTTKSIALMNEKY